jgi:hypothetical protein
LRFPRRAGCTFVFNFGLQSDSTIPAARSPADVLSKKVRRSKWRAPPYSGLRLFLGRGQAVPSDSPRRQRTYSRSCQKVTLSRVALRAWPIRTLRLRRPVPPQLSRASRRGLPVPGTRASSRGLAANRSSDPHRLDAIQAKCPDGLWGAMRRFSTPKRRSASYPNGYTDLCSYFLKKFAKFSSQKTLGTSHQFSFDADSKSSR